MHNTNLAIERLIAAAAEYAPSKAADGVARLGDLGLFVYIREVQALDAGVMALFISEVNASARQGDKGINITCVGRANDMPSAVTDAVAQWSIGVLPVLAHWRGKHSCFCNSRPVETRGGPFDLLAGPVIARGVAEGESQPPTEAADLSKSVLGVLANQRLAQRLHWLELFTCKTIDETVEATCRLDNRDWSPGRRVLVDIASDWPDTRKPMRSCRQFVMLVPKKGDKQEIIVPTFWARLFGRG